MKDDNVTPFEYHGTRTCAACGCAWKMYDLDAPNPVDDLCREPLHDREHGCQCHNPWWVKGYLDTRAQLAEERVAFIDRVQAILR